jgi:hypothetical protein
MKIPICLIGEDSLALASLKQQLDKDAAFSVEGRAYAYGEAFEDCAQEWTDHCRHRY